MRAKSGAAGIIFCLLMSHGAASAPLGTCQNPEPGSQGYKLLHEQGISPCIFERVKPKRGQKREAAGDLRRAIEACGNFPWSSGELSSKGMDTIFSAINGSTEAAEANARDKQAACTIVIDDRHASPAQRALALANRATVSFGLSDHTGAKADIDRAVELMPDNAEYVLGRAWLDEAAGDKEAAIAIYSRVVERGMVSTLADRGRIYAALGRNNAALGRNIEAIQDFDLAFRDMPGDIGILQERATVKETMGNLEGALADLSLGIRLDAKGASSAYQRRSDLRARVGHLAGAYADWAEIAAADDHSAAALAKRAAAALVVDDRDVVIAAAGVAATLADNAAMAVEKAIKSPEIKTEDKEGTKAALEAIFMNPATGAKRDALLLRGVAYGRLERWTEAEADFSAVLAVAPDNAAAYANRAAARRALGNLAGADEDSRMAVGLDAKRYGSEVRGFPDLSLARDAAEAARRVAACDAVAASDLDASRPADVPGIAAMEVNPEVAIEACAGAVAANPGDARMFFNLGRSLHQANDFKTAAAAYVKAVKLGHALAAANFGILYQDGNGVERDLTRARELFQRAADAGAPRGMFLLGNLYERGSGVPQDYAKAWEWYDKAARGNDVLALYSLGQMSADGRGVGQDYGEALRWFRKAEAAGNTTASLRIGDLLGAGQGAPADWTAACTAYDKAAAAGAAEGLRKIGECYMSGRGGRKDAALAMDYFEKAAAAGDSQAAYDAGRYFYDGTSIAKDIKRSLEWLRRAADMGNADGMNDLGALYYNGEGVQPDRAIARQWFDKAAAAGSELAKKNLQNYR